jgi:hypothetical protein
LKYEYIGCKILYYVMAEILLGLCEIFHFLQDCTVTGGIPINTSGHLFIYYYKQ